MKPLIFISQIILMMAHTAANAQLGIDPLFQDHAVLQRGKEIPLTGTANAGAEVSLEMGIVKLRTKTDEAGNWRIPLPAHSAGGPHEMSVSSGAEKIVLADLYFGDVWLCSGQSNMEWTVALSANPEEEIAAADHAMIRHLKVPRQSSYTPDPAVEVGLWEVCTPETAGEFSAVGYYFSRALREYEDVPIGLLNSSWGGSRIEPWMSAEALGYADPSQAGMEIKARTEKEVEERMQKLRSVIGEIPTKDAGMNGEEAVWASEKLNDNHWNLMELPGTWESTGLDLDGIVWYRIKVQVPIDPTGLDTKISLGMIDDSDWTWINGVSVGSMEQAWNTKRVYGIPSGILRQGENTIAVRVDDTGGGGGFHGVPEDMYLEIGNMTIQIYGEWKYQVGEVYQNAIISTNQVPTLLYNAMIYPLLNYPIRGALWYQGESNAGGEDAVEYRDLFPKMISDWRARWQADRQFPFLYVQLANFLPEKDEPSESDWAVLRESQSECLKRLDNVAQAVIIDIGEAEDIHPKNKQDVGRRLALAARKLSYDEDVVYSGPVFREMEKSRNGIQLKFDHCGSGLMSKSADGKSIRGFSVAGTDQKFYWAEASLKGNSVIVTSEQVRGPVAVRYAWADNPGAIELYNREGLPASPFRTDDW